MLSDGVHYQQAMLTGKLNDLVKEEKIRKFTVFRLDNYFCNTVQGRRCASLVRLPAPRGAAHRGAASRLLRENDRYIVVFWAKNKPPFGE